MRLLLDTHALIWWFEDATRLSRTACRAIEDDATEVFVSSVSAFEMNNKRRIGKLKGIDRLIDNLASSVMEQGFKDLPVSVAHAELGGSLAIPHRDPFDRILIAQAQLENAWLLSNERLFDDFGVRRLW